MTTYTLTQEQLDTLMNISDSAYCYKLLKSLKPNTQEPAGEVQHLDELNEQWTKHLPIGTKLYTHPAPQQKQEPRKDTVFGGPKAREQMLNQLVHPAPQQVAGLLATDDFYSWWGENPSLGQQQALVQFYDKQPAQQAKPLTDDQIDKLQAKFSLHNTQERSAYGDAYLQTCNDKYGARNFARAIEQAHGVKP